MKYNLKPVRSKLKRHLLPSSLFESLGPSKNDLDLLQHSTLTKKNISAT